MEGDNIVIIAIKPNVTSSIAIFLFFFNKLNTLIKRYSHSPPDRRILIFFIHDTKI